MKNNDSIPQHIAIIMDGNGRWAKKRFLPRIMGHRAGVEAVRKTIRACIEADIKILTLFAFSSENWQRPMEEVNHLMELFLISLREETKELYKNKVRIRFIGDLSRFNAQLLQSMRQCELESEQHSGLQLIIAANYGGQWDVINAAQQMAQKVLAGTLSVAEINPQSFRQHLATQELPEPDLFIRTGGEIRLSNFLLWQLAYTELFFTDIFWPDFDKTTLEQAILFYRSRERRFGTTYE